MPTNVNTNMQSADGWINVAENAQDVSFSVGKGGIGAYLVGQTADAYAPERQGLPISFTGEHLTLSEGDALFVKLDGLLILIADTPLVADS